MSLVATAQSSKKPKNYHTKSAQGRNSMRMPKSKAKIICPIFANSKYPYHGLGVKLGDPFAITYKYYANEKFAIVTDAGKASSGLYSRYYREKFAEAIASDTLTGEAEIDYLTHKINSDWVAQLKFLWHFNAESVSPGLKVYFGIGAEVKSTKVTYQYLHNTDPNGNNSINSLGQFSDHRLTYGPTLSTGIEYSYFKIPISAFMEVEFYNDIGLDPGWRRFQGGAGLRYVFR